MAIEQCKQKTQKNLVRGLTATLIVHRPLRGDFQSSAKSSGNWAE